MGMAGTLRDSFDEMDRSAAPALVSTLTRKLRRQRYAQLEEIAQIKMPDLNAYDIEAAKLQVKGTARQMGVRVR